MTAKQLIDELRKLSPDAELKIVFPDSGSSCGAGLMDLCEIRKNSQKNELWLGGDWRNVVAEEEPDQPMTSDPVVLLR